ncbi:MAG: GNAT family N-acetyltransferase [Puniceicoccaceae bacterium]
MEIRKFSPQDAKEVSEIVLRNLLEVNTKDYDPTLMATLAEYYTPKEIILASKEKEVFVGVIEEKIVATAALMENEWIHDFFVDPGRHFKGLGRIMIDYLEQLARCRGIKILRVPSSVTAVGFYERLGYSTIKEVVSEEGLTEILMEKNLLAQPAAGGDAPRR